MVWTETFCFWTMPTIQVSLSIYFLSLSPAFSYLPISSSCLLHISARFFASPTSFSYSFYSSRYLFSMIWSSSYFCLSMCKEAEDWDFWSWRLCFKEGVATLTRDSGLKRLLERRFFSSKSRISVVCLFCMRLLILKRIPFIYKLYFIVNLRFKSLLV